MEKAKFKLDPKTKILMCILVNIPAYGIANKNFLLPFILIALGMLFYNKLYKQIMNYLIIYSFLTIIKLLTPILPTILVHMFGTLIISFEMFLPFIAYGMVLIKTSSINEVAISLDNIKAPNFIIIPLLVLFRFFPTIREEKIAISESMKLRGVNFGFKNFIIHPYRTMEFMYVPMLFVLVKTGEELTVASLTRGLGGEEKRTYIKDVKFKFIDILAISLFILMIWICFKMKGM